jgi:flagellar hook-basal body protein
MSFYTSLTGLNAATAQLGVTSNNIANVGTTGFKRSRADFGDIFATSPLQKASSTVGQGVSLKQVTQEFNQGNISFSSNALDLAVTGDGFFPMRSADGLQEVYTRNGSFMLDDQFNVVNSAGQRLMAATVDSTGSANVNERVVLNIPQKTSGEAKQTSQVNLGLNFPSDAGVITESFNRNNPATYNKSTALTVYDNGGNGYLATIYYVKTQNASQSSPYNKWQTYVFVGEDQVGASLQQATDSNGEQLYVNQYGQLKPYSAVKDEITTAKTQLFSLDELTDKRTSTAATVQGIAANSKYDFTNGIDFKALTTAGTLTKTQLANLFTLDVDGSGSRITMDLSYLADSNTPVTGAQLATEMTNVLQRKFGDEATFNFPDTASKQFTISTDRISSTVANPVQITLETSNFTKGGTVEDVVSEIQNQLDHTINSIGTYTGHFVLDANGKPALDSNGDYVPAVKTTASGSTTYSLPAGYTSSNGYTVSTQISVGIAPTQSTGLTKTTNDLAFTAATPNGKITANYDYSSQSLKFTDSKANSVIKVSSGSTSKNSVLGMPSTPVQVDDNGLVGTKTIPNGTSIRAAALQRYGMKVTYDSVNHTFSVISGSTGDQSSLSLQMAQVGSKDDPVLVDFLGLSSTNVDTSKTALRGTASTSAVAYGTTPTVNMSNNFAVDETNNSFVVTVDGIKGTVVIPPDPNYSVSTFIDKLQRGINAMAANNPDGTPHTVNGVKVSYDTINNKFVFTSGTTGADSYIKISGSSAWGLENVDAGRGSVTTWIHPTQHKDVVGGVLQPKYIDSAGAETTSGDGFTTLPPWSPVYLQKGQLTFDTGGKLVSPLKGTQLDTVYLAGGKGALTINVNYSGSTQYQSAFAVLSQSQDGAPEGDLVGVTIGNDGLVSASFSNGTQKSLAKILLANFSSPSGLRQIGDSSFLSSAASGKPILGNAGSAGFGTLRAGATERSNVDLTSELVDLITAQRNFQANAKAIETSSTMTSAIINLRS